MVTEAQKKRMYCTTKKRVGSSSMTVRINYSFLTVPFTSYMYMCIYRRTFVCSTEMRKPTTPKNNLVSTRDPQNGCLLHVSVPFSFFLFNILVLQTKSTLTLMV